MLVERREPRDKCRRAGGVSPLMERGDVAPSLCDDISRLTPTARLAFTLTELLVVMVIMVILTTMTVFAVNFTLAAERSRAAARQVQSYLEGARDRAIYESQASGVDHPVGVRFILDPNIIDSSGNSVAASSMLFIENVDPQPEGEVRVNDPGSGGDWLATRTGGQPTWSALARKGLLVPGVRIKINVNGAEFPYTIQSVDGSNERVSFKPALKGGTTGQIYPFKLELPPVVRPNQEPMLLPRGIVIDLDRSQIPAYWRNGSAYINQLDIMFSPRGTVRGRAAAGGLIHFYLAEAADVDRLNSIPLAGIPADAPYGPGEDPIGDRLLVTLFPQTGAISSHPVNPTDTTPADNRADDPYRYAELGEVAGE